MSIYEFIKSRQNIYPFHMPGHKRNPKFFHVNFLDTDITEVYGADNLKEPDGIIKSLEEKIAKLYGADQSFILVNGSTCGIEAALFLANKEIIMARNSHMSAYNAVVLSGATPHFVYPELSPYSFATRIDACQIKDALDKFPNAEAVFITSPTYEGFCSDIEAIAKLVHSKNKILIVDEAHGAHFGFHDAFPKSAIHYGADIVIQSLHKTLPVPTQCSVLHIKGNRVCSDDMKRNINLLQTSSPSYFFMCCVEQCIDLLIADSKKIFSEYNSNLSAMIENLSETKFITLETNDYTRFDKGKLLFYLNSELSGREFSDLLRHEYHIELEFSGTNHALAMTSFADTAEGFLKLRKSILNIDSQLTTFKKCDNICLSYFEAEQKYSPREAFYMPKEDVQIKDCVGRTMGDYLIPYPPGIPLIAPGEVITEQLLDHVLFLRNKGINMMGQGSAQNKVKVVKSM